MISTNATSTDAAAGPALSEGLGAIEPRGCPTPGACSAVALIEELRHDRDELLTQLRAVVDRMAYDGVPNDSLPVWSEARGVLARLVATN